MFTALGVGLVAATGDQRIERETIARYECRATFMSGTFVSQSDVWAFSEAEALRKFEPAAREQLVGRTVMTAIDCDLRAGQTPTADTTAASPTPAGGASTTLRASGRGADAQSIHVPADGRYRCEFAWHGNSWSSGGARLFSGYVTGSLVANKIAENDRAARFVTLSAGEVEVEVTIAAAATRWTLVCSS